MERERNTERRRRRRSVNKEGREKKDEETKANRLKKDHKEIESKQKWVETWGEEGRRRKEKNKLDKKRIYRINEQKAKNMEDDYCVGVENMGGMECIENRIIDKVQRRNRRLKKKR